MIYFLKQNEAVSCVLVERPSTIVDVDSGNSLLVVPDPFGTLEMPDAHGEFHSLLSQCFYLQIVPVFFLDRLLLDAFLEKLIEGLKSPDTSSLMLPDLLSLSDPFSGSVESVKGVRL